MSVDIEIEVEGKRYSGSYEVVENMISVFFEGHSCETQIDGAKNSIEALAKMQLRALVKNKALK